MVERIGGLEGGVGVVGLGVVFEADEGEGGAGVVVELGHDGGDLAELLADLFETVLGLSHVHFW